MREHSLCPLCLHTSRSSSLATSNSTLALVPRSLPRSLPLSVFCECIRFALDTFNCACVWRAKRSRQIRARVRVRLRIHSTRTNIRVLVQHTAIQCAYPYWHIEFANEYVYSIMQTSSITNQLFFCCLEWHVAWYEDMAQEIIRGMISHTLVFAKVT